MDKSKEGFEVAANVVAKEAGAGMAADSSLLADREALSALVDDEAGELEVRRVVRKLPDNPELLATWKRYQLIQASLHGQAHVRPGVDLVAGIEAALADEPAPSIVQRRFGALARLAGQGAIAASVAAFALVGIGSLEIAQNQGSSAGASVASATSVDTSVEEQLAMPQLAGEYNPSGLERTVRLDNAARTRLQQAVYRFSSGPTAAEAPMQLIFELPQRQELAPQSLDVQP